MLSFCITSFLWKLLHKRPNQNKDPNPKIQTPQKAEDCCRHREWITAPSADTESKEAIVLLASQERSAIEWWLLVTNITSPDFCSFSSPFPSCGEALDSGFCCWISICGIKQLWQTFGFDKPAGLPKHIHDQAQPQLLIVLLQNQSSHAWSTQHPQTTRVRGSRS